MKQSAHIPVYQGGLITPDTAILAQTGQEAPENAYVLWFKQATFLHQPGCSCCGSRAHVARAFSTLFRARATGAAPFFMRVVVLADAAGWAEVTHALTHDAVTRARFKLATT